MSRVSVLTSIYNTNPAHLRECIDSILAQTFTDFEFIILNDSPDNAELDSVIASYNDPRIRYEKNAHNIGISKSRNRLLKMARGEYIAIFDHDDISVPERLEKQVEFLDRHPHIGVVSGWLEYFGADTHIWQTPEFDLDIRVHLTQNCAVAHTAAMIRKSILAAHNIEYEEFYTPAEDYRLWARLMDVTHFHNLQMVLVKYRWENNNTSRRLCALSERAAAHIRMELGGKYPEYRHAYKHTGNAGTTFRLRPFGVIPLIKIKRNWIYLFEAIPLCKLKWD